MNKHGGFTMLEIVIVVAIIGILAAIAMPNYADYVTRGALVEAHAGLGAYKVQMEQYYQDNRNYGTGPCGATTPTYKNFDQVCALGGAGGQSYTVTTTGKVGSRAAGFTFTINEQNQRQTTAAPSGWGTTPMPANCFIVRKGSC